MRTYLVPCSERKEGERTGQKIIGAWQTLASSHVHPVVLRWICSSRSFPGATNLVVTIPNRVQAWPQLEIRDQPSRIHGKESPLNQQWSVFGTMATLVTWSSRATATATFVSDSVHNALIPRFRGYQSHWLKLKNPISYAASFRDPEIESDRWTQDEQRCFGRRHAVEHRNFESVGWHH